MCSCKQTTSKSFQTGVYVYTYSNCLVYQISVVILLTNDLTNICSKRSNIEFMNRLYLQCERARENRCVEFEKIARKLMYFASLTKII